MISVILYGRNDSYGYNLHKRAAISLNCIAEILTQEEDEIIFVDYNTPDDFPTFPEAIFDTLTKKAKNKLRILRVRPNEHNQIFGDRTHLKTLEPVARNVAIRRSNPKNKWVLSTNTDMIFVPRNEISLSKYVEDIPEGIYCTARFEIPESIWENYDRLNPTEIIDLSRLNGESFHLNEVVKAYKWILYDGPGDFQLIPRKDLFEIYGFDEEMLLGWHVDSNISKRLFMKYGLVQDALPFIFGYHCDHTRQITPMHRYKSPQNDPNRFVFQVNQIRAEHQKDSWGFPNLDIEEISLNSKSSDKYCEVIKNTVGKPQKELTTSFLLPETFDNEEASYKHIFPFLVDLFSSMKRNIKIVWAGETEALYELFAEALRNLEFSEHIEILKPEEVGVKEFPLADAFIMNFGCAKSISDKEKKITYDIYRYLIELEKENLKKELKPRKFIAINANHNSYETLINQTIIAAKTPFSTRLRHGYLNLDCINNLASDEIIIDPVKKFFYSNTKRTSLLLNIRKTKIIKFFRTADNDYTYMGKIVIKILNQILNIQKANKSIKEDLKIKFSILKSARSKKELIFKILEEAGMQALLNYYYKFKNRKNFSRKK